MEPRKVYKKPEEDPASPYFLTTAERWWRDRQPMLQARGYMLRPRFRPGWKPSWIDTNGYPGGHEDGLMTRDKVDHMDATRISDGKTVHIKALVPFPETGKENVEELDVALFFSSEPRRSDPRNHCVPILDWWRIPEEKTSFIVMPLLRVYNSPEFLTVGEAVDFFGQVMEGLAFMHENYVAHRDCCSANVMMDPTDMYPKSFHPAETDMDQDLRRRAPHSTRTECAPKYYFIDFGLSDRFDPQNGPWPPLSVKTHGADRTAPEMNHSPLQFYDPFPTDIYYIGNLIKIDFLQQYRNLEFMDSLIDKMTSNDPHQRPTIHQALSEFKTLRRSLPTTRLRLRLASRTEPPVAGVWKSGKHLLRSARWIGSGLPAVPQEHDGTVNTVADLLQRMLKAIGKAGDKRSADAYLTRGQEEIDQSINHLEDNGNYLTSRQKQSFGEMINALQERVRKVQEASPSWKDSSMRWQELRSVFHDAELLRKRIVNTTSIKRNEARVAEMLDNMKREIDAQAREEQQARMQGSEASSASHQDRSGRRPSDHQITRQSSDNSWSSVESAIPTTPALPASTHEHEPPGGRLGAYYGMHQPGHSIATQGSPMAPYTDTSSPTTFSHAQYRGGTRRDGAQYVAEQGLGHSMQGSAAGSTPNVYSNSSSLYPVEGQAYRDRDVVRQVSSQAPRNPTQQAYLDPVTPSRTQPYVGRGGSQQTAQHMTPQYSQNPAQQSSATPNARLGITTPSSGQYPRREERPREQIPATPQHGRTSYDQAVSALQNSTIHQHQQPYRDRRADYGNRARDPTATQYGGSASQVPTSFAQPYRGQNPYQTNDNRYDSSGCKYVTTTNPTGAHHVGCMGTPCTCTDIAWHHDRAVRVAKRDDPRDSMYPHPSSSRDDLASHLVSRTSFRLHISLTSFMVLFGKSGMSLKDSKSRYR
ncbi:hypothetical protein EVG20_g2245 [Dentipellis fragilis]|uniref:Protein kinase domain-containing protein n=1 Tax=Dentipellis fragilis TaxID=205917 RepID=A0A4Y9Z8A6_9AGAM|nr:hypothetical protein EVG20_g2245 [Dentipellis fragilis]